MKYILLILIPLLAFNLSAQNDCPECEKFNITGIYDLPPSPKAPGGNFFILMLTLNENLDPSFDPNYADLYFIDNSGDTISIPSGPNQTLPTRKFDTVPYIMELNTIQSNQDFPADFDGKLVIRNPTGPPCPNVTYCHINFKLEVTNISESVEKEEIAMIFPNPAEDEIRITANKNIKEVNIYDLKGTRLKKVGNYDVKTISLKNMNNSFLIVHLLFDNGDSEVHRIIKR